jgi:hypothetical protein
VVARLWTTAVEVIPAAALALGELRGGPTAAEERTG